MRGADRASSPFSSTSFRGHLPFWVRIGNGKKEAVREDSEEGWRLDSTRRGNRVNDLRFPPVDAIMSKSIAYIRLLDKSENQTYLWNRFGEVGSPPSRK